MEDGVVESETKSDGVSSLEVLLSSLSSFLVSFMSVVSSFISLFTGSVFRDVSVVVSFHLMVEDLSLSVGGFGDEAGVDEVEDLVAVFVKFSFNFVLVASKETDILGSLLLFLLFDRGKGSPSGSSGADGVLEGDGEEVSLFDGEVRVGSDDFVHGIKHVLKAFGLLGDLGHVEVFFSGVGSHIKFK